MSRGPGKIERAIAEAFRANPTHVFTVTELVCIAYHIPVELVEHKHEVVVRLAAQRAAKRLHWKVWHGTFLDHRAPDPLRERWDRRGFSIRYICKLDEAHYLRCLRSNYPEFARDDDNNHSKAMAHHLKLFNRHLRWESQIARWLVAGQTEQAAELQAQLDYEGRLYRGGMLGASDIAAAILAGDARLVEEALQRGDRRFNYLNEDGSPLARVFRGDTPLSTTHLGDELIELRGYDHPGWS
jgi:hypothetical protein